MNISCTKKALLFCAFFVMLSIKAQHNYEGLNESGFAINHKVSSSYRLNFSLSSRAYLYQNEVFNYEQRQIDLTHFSTFYLSYNNSLSVGLRYRNRSLFNDSSNEIRFTEQYNFTTSLEPLRFGHRFRLEQRILDQFTVHRMRYRFAVDMPLNGLKLDIGEAYFIAAMEALFSITSAARPEWDHRTTLQLGWLLSESFKLQVGLEYRFEAINIETQQKLFTLISGILNL